MSAIQQELNEEQHIAASFSGKHLLVIAGAGTGKTKTIIARAQYLIEQGISPTNILILSFTRKSAGEIAERIKAGCNNSAGLTGHTFHSWCMSLIKSNPSIFGFTNATCLDEEDRESAIKLLCGKNFKDQDDRRIPPYSVVEVYSYAKNTKCSLSKALQVKVYDNEESDFVKEKILKNKPLYEDIIRKYILYKKEHNYIDYDDILSIVSAGLKNNPRKAEQLSSQYKHILVDEMQDTNPLQYELLSSFYSNSHLFCVGDDAQSIYGFRGADFETMHNFTNIVPESTSLYLSLNYRSTQEILDVSNWLLSRSPLNYKKDLRASRGHGTKPKMIYVDNVWEEANLITDDILASMNNDGYAWKDHMVLSRSNWGLKKVEACCLAKKIPYQLFGGTSLMQTKHIRDIMSALRISANYQDELAWVRYLQLWPGIGDVKAAKAIQAIHECLSLEECISALEKDPLQSEPCRVLAALDGLQSNPYKAIRKAVSCMSNRLSILYKNDGWTNRKKDFKLLQELARSSSSLTEFIAEFVLDPKLGTYFKAGSDNGDLVTLSTIHSAKGLEAANCYITGVSPYSYPTSKAVLNGVAAIEEERRCLYVACTRAKNKLHLYCDTHVTSAKEFGTSKDFFDGEITKGLRLIHKNTGIEVEIHNIINKNGYQFIQYTINGCNVQEMEESMFRKAYTTKKEYDANNACSFYFLNGIPNDIIDKIHLDSDNNTRQKQFNEDGNNPFRWDDFDFN